MHSLLQGLETCTYKVAGKVCRSALYLPLPDLSSLLMAVRPWKIPRHPEMGDPGPSMTLTDLADEDWILSAPHCTLQVRHQPEA